MATKTTTPAVKGVRTTLQTVGGLLTGLVLAVWHVPGVPEAVHSYVADNFVPLLVGTAVLVGVPAGIIAWAQNKLGK